MTKVAELRDGDQMWSPAGRWETVTAVECRLDGYLIAIRTNKTGEHSWILAAHTEVHVLTAYEQRHQRTVSVEATGDGGIIAVLSDPSYTAWHWDEGSVTLAQASYRRGEGWTVADRPGGGDVVTEAFDSKGAARSAIIRAARAHAKGLGVKYRGRVGAA